MIVIPYTSELAAANEAEGRAHVELSKCAQDVALARDGAGIALDIAKDGYIAACGVTMNATIRAIQKEYARPDAPPETKTD